MSASAKISAGQNHGLSVMREGGAARTSRALAAFGDFRTLGALAAVTGLGALESFRDLF